MVGLNRLELRARRGLEPLPFGLEPAPGRRHLGGEPVPLRLDRQPLLAHLGLEHLLPDSERATLLLHLGPNGTLFLDGDGPAHNIAVMSNVSPAYAPADKALVAGACPGRLDPDAEPAVRAQLRSVWGTEVDGWTHLRTDAIPHGQPAQPPSFPPKQRTRLADGLHVCGDHRDTASIQGALFSGRRCAETILAGP